jgi:tetratricopeptide (TPR) repeat protein
VTDASPETIRHEELALAAFRRGLLPEAIEGFAAARSGYAATDSPLKAAEMANNLAVALLQAGRASEAVAAARGTPEVFLQAGDDLRAAQAYGNLGSALEAARDAAAADSYRRAADLFRRLGERDSLALVQRSLSSLQLRAGRPLAALASMREAAEGTPTRGVRGRFLRWLLRLPFARYLSPPRP